MLICSDGRFAGSVSGGCVEGDVLALANDVIAEGRPRRNTYGIADAGAWEIGLPCGGEIEVLLQPISCQGFPPTLFDAIETARAGGHSCEIETDLSTGISTSVRSDTVHNFVNYYRPGRRLLIVGGVQIAQSLVEFVRLLGLSPVVIDPRAKFLTKDRFPTATLDGRWPDEAIRDRRPEGSTGVVTLSHDPKIDDPALLAALGTPAGYIAALGSHRSHEKRLERLAAAGIKERDLARVEGPAGLAIGAVGVAEIALAIAAAMVARLNLLDHECLDTRDMMN